VLFYQYAFPRRKTKYTTATTPIIANNNPKFDVGVGESIGLYEGVYSDSHLRESNAEGGIYITSAYPSLTIFSFRFVSLT